MLAASSPTAPLLVVIDASVWISRLLPLDSNHAPARNWLAQHVRNNGRLVAPTLMLAEVAGTLARIQQSPAQAPTAIADLHAYTALEFAQMDQEVVDETADLAAGFSLRGADAIYVAVAKRMAIPLVTFDQEQLTRPAGVITTIRP